MKKVILILLFMFQSSIIFGQTRLYENPKFDAIAKDHKIIAVIPFKATVNLRPKQMEKITPEQLERMEKSEGEAIQLAMISWFFKREEQGRLTVKIQPAATTNAKLNQAGLSVENFDSKTPQELASVLEVDAVVMGTFQTSKPMSEGASLALGALFGFWGATNNAVINLFIYNGQDGEVLVNYNKGVSGSIGSSTEDLINILMRKASRRIAYTK